MSEAREVTVRSPDGTRIECDVVGAGPPVVLVDGAMCTRSFGSKPELVRRLAADFTVCSYDRRGRGGSGDTTPYAVEREIEDLGAVIDAAGGRAFVYGHSSGACLALEAAVALGGAIPKLVMYEAPYNQDPAARVAWSRYLHQLSDALGSGRRGDAVALFMAHVGTPEDQLLAIRRSPAWPGLEAVAPTLAYDHAGLVGEDGSIPFGRAERVGVPTLVMHGEVSHPFMAETARWLGRAIPGAEVRTLEGQHHNVEPAALAPVLVEFLGRT